MRILTLSLAALAVAAAAPALAHDYRIGGLQVGHPWSRATPPGASVYVAGTITPAGPFRTSCVP